MREMLDEKLKRFEELEKKLVDPEILSSGAKISVVQREYGSLAKLVNRYRRYKNIIDQIAEADEIIAGDDLEMRELAEAELPELKGEREIIWKDLLDMTIGGDDAERTRCIMEIRAGTGGDEAALFARDLYEMYKRHAEQKKWKIEIMSTSPTELGGFKEITLCISGRRGSPRMLRAPSARGPNSIRPWNQPITFPSASRSATFSVRLSSSSLRV